MSHYWKNEFESSVVTPNVSEIKANNTKLIKQVNDVLKALAPPKSDTHIIAAY